jgi:hypothetical protein
MAVFTDGLAICAVGVNGIWLVSDAALPRFGALGALLLALIRPGQRAVCRRPLVGARLTIAAQA